MINLNSLILEGKVYFEPSIIEEDGKKKARFSVETSRIYEGEVLEVSRFVCECFGVMTEEKFIKKIVKDRGIRIVGRIKQYENAEQSYVCIVCEHIEFKPIRK